MTDNMQVQPPAPQPQPQAPMAPQAPIPPQAPMASQAHPQGGSGFGIAALILGILSLCASSIWWCGGPFSIVGIILGALGLNRSGRGMAIAGLVLSLLGLLSLIIFRIFFHGILLDHIFQQWLTNHGY